MKELQVFNFKDNEVRTLTIDGDVWFIAKDVAEILEYSDAEAITRRLDADEVQNLQVVGFGNRGVNVINESGLYGAVLGSKKPEAKAFKKWVTSEVLPSIRKTGSYSMKPVELSLDADRLFRSHVSVAELIYKGNQALISANRVTLEETGVDILKNHGATKLLAEHKSVLLTVSEIGVRFGVSDMVINATLEMLGYQKSYRDGKNRLQWEPTRKGADYCEMLDAYLPDVKGSSRQHLQWKSEIIDILKGDFE